MAPSYRSKRARNTNPLDLSRLLKDDEQQKRFLNHYIERPVMTPKYGSFAAFEEQGCHFPSLIWAQGLHVFVEDKTPSTLSLFESAAGSSRETLGVDNLIVENRLLHYFLEYVIFEKGSKYSQVNDFELQLLYGILNMESINWSFIIFQLMINQTTKFGLLAYAFAITRILQKFNVDFTIELETPFSIKEHRIDLTSLGKMQIVEAPDGSLRHKDHQVEDDAPLEAPAQPAPPAPQDLGNSPYYQSIMDELAGQREKLVNMCSYMTTRMDHMDSRFDEITSLLRNLQPRDPPSF
ncbi:hypothetical protein Lal_00048542 [Lupinus albus]|nr:hypothetical protein Lal_00048542 [Lupinus albus]